MKVALVIFDLFSGIIFLFEGKIVPGFLLIGAAGLLAGALMMGGD